MNGDESPQGLRTPRAASNPLNNCSCFGTSIAEVHHDRVGKMLGGPAGGGVVQRIGSQEDRWPARKIITHAQQEGGCARFYNPTQHPFFDQEGGGMITSKVVCQHVLGEPAWTPYYEYNQIMYRVTWRTEAEVFAYGHAPA